MYSSRRRLSIVQLVIGVKRDYRSVWREQVMTSASYRLVEKTPVWLTNGTTEMFRYH